ncbi:hypothetical protein CEXT_382961 [Caerostris extrusa]|uniref:Uncharacterized protein n=1 Tax=Caerostris extrusa TaxID=172846 RepID=A0AAV4PBF1_CAEEX|nr:hypothetical protein CEXT_382961 [Caerostris extrusa]
MPNNKVDCIWLVRRIRCHSDAQERIFQPTDFRHQSFLYENACQTPNQDHFIPSLKTQNVIPETIPTEEIPQKINKTRLLKSQRKL